MWTNPTVETTIDYAKIIPSRRTGPRRSILPPTGAPTTAQPELRLMGAILEDAVATLMTDVRRCTQSPTARFRRRIELDPRPHRPTIEYFHSSTSAKPWPSIRITCGKD